MKKNWITFLVSFAIVFAGSFLYYQWKAPADQATDTAEQTPAKETAPASEPAKTAEPAATATSADGQIFTQAGCIACHSVSALNVQGGATGPDLSKAYENVEGKHGVPLEDFLKKPTSAVMSSVLGSDPLTDEERKMVMEALKKASEK